MHYVYIVECKDGTYYTGWTTDIRQRIDTHNQGKGAKYTRGRFPVVLKYVKEMEGKSEALKMERLIKKMTKTQKQKLMDAYASDLNNK